MQFQKKFKKILSSGQRVGNHEGKGEDERRPDNLGDVESRTCRHHLASPAPAASARAASPRRSLWLCHGFTEA